eukprot:12421180-Karenia_brevis.AAC.1
MQIDGGRYFLHEHPAGASSWKLGEMLKFMQQEGIISEITNMCCFGMETTNSERDGTLLVSKPTRFMTNAPELMKIIHRRCQGGHEHGRLISGRAKEAAIYPPALCQAVVHGIKQQVAWDAKHHGGQSGQKQIDDDQH